MNRLYKVVATLFVVISCLSVSALAADETRYHFEDTSGEAHNEISVTIPEGYWTFTRDIDPNHPGLKALGADAQALSDHFRKNTIFIDAISPDANSEIFIKMNATKDSIATGNMNLFSDKELAGLREEIIQGLKNQNITLLSYQVYIAGNQKYMYMHSSYPRDDGSTLYSVAYSTVINKFQVAFYFNNYNEDVTDSQKEQLKHVVDTAEFYPKPVSAAAATVTKVGTSFLKGFVKYAVIGLILGAGGTAVAAIKKKKSVGQPIWTEDTPATEPVPPQTPNPVAQETPAGILICTTCGMKNQNDRLVCYRCGRPLHLEPKAEETADESESDESFKI